MTIPVIDIFAGPGGLGEGFSSVYKGDKRVFDIKLSIEKDESAHETLELRSFFRQFDKGKVPEDYYKVLQAEKYSDRQALKQALFEKYSEEYSIAKEEAWQAELGSDEFPSEVVDKRIRTALEGSEEWVLIGGPPCQAFSLVGRSRVGGIDDKDHRVYLYKEYLRIIAVHQPAVFVMENVKGLLSAKVNNENVFSWMKKDLKDPSSAVKNTTSKKYRIYSLTTKATDFDDCGHPNYDEDRDFLIQSEKYGIPQKRHRVILLGIRDDIKVGPDPLKEAKDEVRLKDVISDLPKIRSGLNRSFVSSEMKEGKKRRKYKKEIDTDENWQNIINSFRKEIISWNGFAKDYSDIKIAAPLNGTGSEFVKCKTPTKKNPRFDWYNDPMLGGACNHESRTHLTQDLKRYMFASMFSDIHEHFPRLHEYDKHSKKLLPDHENATSGKFADRFRVQLPDRPATTVTSHISKDGHYFIHYDPDQCRSLTVREAARIQTFPDNYLFCGSRTAQYHQVGNAVPPYLAFQIAKVVLGVIKKIR